MDVGYLSRRIISDFRRRKIYGGRRALRNLTRLSETGLPGRLDHAGNLAVEGEFTKRDTRHPEFPDVRTRTTAERATIADAGGRRVARELLQLLLGGEKFVVRRRWIEQ